MISTNQILSAYRIIRPHIRRTPIVEVDGADFGIDTARLTLKLESLQHAGSFKARGAFTNLLTRSVPAVGVVAASGGNHGAAVAFAAMRRRVPAKIFVPNVASSAKIQQISAYGAQLLIHAFDQEETLLGQGTVALELEEQASDITTLLVAVGGGGLIAGIAAWYQGRIKVIGVEPELAPTLTRALAAGRPVDAEAGGIAADSLAPRRVGELVFPIVQRHVSTTVLVSDDAIQDAQRLLWKNLRVVAEPGGAAALAALSSHRYLPAANERVAVLICGGNTTAVDFER